MILLISILYFIMLFICVVGAVFIIFHVVRYSYSRAVAMLTLAIFIPVLFLLMMVNFTVFSSLKLEEIFNFAGLVKF